jgi:hypothetical protein
MSTGAASFVDAYPGCRYPAVMVGSSNGALTNLAVAARVPWLPDTVLGPVAGAPMTDPMTCWHSAPRSLQRC